MATQIEKMTTALLEGPIRGLGNRADAHDDHLEAVDTHLSSTDNRVTGLAASVDTLGVTVEEHTGQIGSQGRTVAGHTTQIGDIRRHEGVTRTALRGLVENTHRIGTRVTANTRDIDTINSNQPNWTAVGIVMGIMAAVGLAIGWMVYVDGNAFTDKDALRLFGIAVAFAMSFGLGATFIFKEGSATGDPRVQLVGVLIEDEHYDPPIAASTTEDVARVRAMVDGPTTQRV